ncbi:2OG-Fe(II) oxygenase [Alteromonas sp. MMG017]|uniref:2OG-Fe(II) oxygenase n=1 Tax=Alteromonas sp. MMG017 TaxID=2822692 RepID=UPI0032B51B7D
MEHVPSRWKSWVVKNLLSGTALPVIIEQLTLNGFDAKTVRSLLGSNLPEKHVFDRDIEFYRKLAFPAFLHQPSNQNVSCLYDEEQIQLYRVDDFLPADECHEVISLSSSKLTPSKLTGAPSTAGIRTSSTCELAFMQSELVTSIDSRVVNFLDLGVGEKEVIQAQHYEEGQYFKPHFDFFPPGTPQYLEHAKTRGQRTWTCMIYLDDVMEGGHTHFTKIGLSIKPRRGAALIWNNLTQTGAPNFNTLHYAEPVTTGNKNVITKWFRDRN